MTQMKLLVVFGLVFFCCSSFSYKQSRPWRKVTYTWFNPNEPERKPEPSYNAKYNWDPNMIRDESLKAEVFKNMRIFCDNNECKFGAGSYEGDE